MQKKFLRTSVLTLGLLASALTTMTDIQAISCKCRCADGDKPIIGKTLLDSPEACQAFCEYHGWGMLSCD